MEANLVNSCEVVSFLLLQPMAFPLQYIKRDPIVSTKGGPPMLILLHGLGSNEQDLFSFAPLLDPKFLILSVRAPLSYGIRGYAWFNLDFSGPLPAANVQQAEQARQLVTDFVQEAIATFGPNPAQVYLAGFSQGAIMSYATAFTSPQYFAGIVGMSGYIMKESTQKFAQAASLKHLKILVTHGTRDQVLPVYLGKMTDQYLQSLSVNYEYQEYDMGHEVNQACLQRIQTWLSEQVKDAQA